MPNLPGWLFEVRERSAGVYVVSATKEGAVRFEKSGEDPDLLIDEAHRYAEEVEPGSRA
jgi:hypothetical protein